MGSNLPKTGKNGMMVMALMTDTEGCLFEHILFGEQILSGESGLILAK